LRIDQRRELWQSIATDLMPRHLDDITRDVSIREAPDTLRKIVGGGVTGRTRVVVKDGF
jgi:acrylyl-CoA reductase (NADPH)